jgi:hypothetical protein
MYTPVELMEPAPLAGLSVHVTDWMLLPVTQDEMGKAGVPAWTMRRGSAVPAITGSSGIGKCTELLWLLASVIVSKAKRTGNWKPFNGLTAEEPGESI